MQTTREERALAEGVLFERREELGTLVIEGPDGRTWLNGLVTCDLKSLAPGRGAYGFAVGKTGRILAELWIAPIADRIVVAIDRSRTAELLEHFDRHLIMEDARVEDASAVTTWLFAHGRGAAELGSSAPDGADIDWTGRGDGAVFALHVDRRDERERELLAGAGTTSLIAAPDAMEALRIGWGLPRFGVDYTVENLPQEASIERLGVSFEKGCYLGQETVFMLETRGHPKKRLVRYALAPDAEVAVGAPVLLASDHAEIGAVTSIGPADPSGARAAIGFAKFKHAVAGTAVEVGGRPATVVERAGAPLHGA